MRSDRAALGRVGLVEGAHEGGARDEGNAGVGAEDPSVATVGVLGLVDTVRVPRRRVRHESRRRHPAHHLSPRVGAGEGEINRDPE
jgi:hypothetical protein